jgi:hypothetical protein
MRAPERASTKLIAFALFAALSQGCGTGEDQTTETVGGGLSQNVAYTWAGKSLQARGGTDPGAAVFNGNAVFSYVTPGAQIGIIIERQLNGSGQNILTNALPDTTNYGAALIPWNSYLYMVYVGQDRNVYMKRSLDASTWEATRQIANRGGANGFQFSPALVVWDGQLLVYVDMDLSSFWVGGVTNALVQLNVDSSGSVSGPWNPGSPEITNDTPTAMVMNNQVLYLSWAGSASNKPIYIKHYTDAGGWSNDSILTGQYGHPALFQQDIGTIKLVYRGMDSQAHIFHTYSQDGSFFYSPVEDNNSLTWHTPIPFYASGASTWTFYVGENNLLYTAME